MRKQKGGRGKKTTNTQNSEKELWKLICPQLIKYRDHVLYRNTSPKSTKLSERITIGWVIKETEEYLEICWDLPTWLQKYEICDRMSGMKILKSAILERYWFN